jgi:hypothetical protein
VLQLGWSEETHASALDDRRRQRRMCRDRLNGNKKDLELMAMETRFQVTDQRDHPHYEALVDQARHHIATRVAFYRELARAQ